MKSLCSSLLLLTGFAASGLFPEMLLSADWPGWRGPHGNGQANGSGYPVEWSLQKNLLWKAEIPGIGASTPAVSQDSIFLTTTVDGQNTVLCFAMDGKLRWTQPLGSAVDGKPGKDGTGANPSVTTDGKNVFAYFKSGDLGCFSVAGELKWQTNLQQRYGEDTLWWDLGTSPVLTENAVVVACMHSGPSYVAAFGKEDGKLLWKQDRNLGAPEEAAQSYSTPVVVNEGGRATIVVLGADHVTAYDGRNGSELWRVGGLNPTQHKYFRSIAGPAVADGFVIAPYARGESLTAIKLGGSGDVTASHVVWEKKETSADVPTPAIAEGRVFICRDVGIVKGTIDCLDLITGETIWSGRLEQHRSTFRSSPVFADGKLYVTRQDGTVFVLDGRASEFRVLAKNVMADEHTVATPVFVNGRILIRSSQHLYLIGS